MRSISEAFGLHFKKPSEDFSGHVFMIHDYGSSREPTRPVQQFLQLNNAPRNHAQAEMVLLSSSPSPIRAVPIVLIVPGW